MRMLKPLQLPLSIAAAAIASAALSVFGGEGNEVSYKFQYYRDNNIVDVLTNTASANLRLNDHWRVNAGILVDAITAASRKDHHQLNAGPDGITSATPRNSSVDGVTSATPNSSGSTVDAVTSATPTNELRKQVNGTLSYTYDFLKRFRKSATESDDPTTLGISGITSTENDYNSTTIGASFSQDLFQRNYTVALAFSRSFDQYRPPAKYIPGPADEGWNYLGDGRRLTDHLDIGYTQGLTTTTEASIMGGYVYDRGYLSRPYYSYKINDVYYPENLPPEHKSYTVTAKVNQYIPLLKGCSLHATYRYYTDSWAMRSHTLELELYTRLSENIILRPSARFYTQNSAFFYQDVYLVVPEYLTTDFKYRQSVSGSGGLKFIWELRDFVKPQNGSLLGLYPTEFDIGVDAFHRTGTDDYLIRNAHYNYWNVETGFLAVVFQTGIRAEF
jgi:hypothetical protein